MASEPWLVLVNPSAGARPPQIDRVAAALAGHTIAAELQTPTTAEEMRSALQSAWTQGRRRFVAVGGDGTLNLLANELVGREEPPTLGVLPAGTGCDLLRTFGIPQQVEAAAAHLAGDRTYPVDVGVLEGAFGRRLFVNVGQAGVGASAAEGSQKLPRRLGSARYLAAFALRLPGFRETQIELITDRRTVTSPALAVIFANGQFFAGGWNVAPRATVVDGLLDLQVISARKWEAFRLVPKLVRGLHLTDKAVRRLAAPSFQLRTEIPWPVEADGEPLGNTPVVGTVLSAALLLKI